MQYILRNDKLQVKCCTLGAELLSIQTKSGQEYLWQGDATFWAGQAPVLFPICGGLRHNQATTLEGELLKIPKHGLVRQAEFTCDKYSEQELILVLELDEVIYPYPCKLYVQYLLVEDELLIQYVVHNLGARCMPFFIGGHPGFNCPLNLNLTFDDYYVEFESEEDTTVASVNLVTDRIDRMNRRPVEFDGQKLRLEHALFKQDALVFDQVRSNKVWLKSDKDSMAIQLNYLDFPNLLLWSSRNNGKFIAIEPMIGVSTYADEDDIFEHKANVQYVEPNNLAFYHYSIKIIS